MEGDEDIRLGMESGFDSSPMARLLLEYSGNSDNLEASTLLMEMNINLALDISELPPDMIKDTVRNQEAGHPGKLATDFLQLLVLHEMSKKLYHWKA